MLRFETCVMRDEVERGVSMRGGKPDDEKPHGEMRSNEMLRCEVRRGVAMAESGETLGGEVLHGETRCEKMLRGKACELRDEAERGATRRGEKLFAL